MPLLTAIPLTAQEFEILLLLASQIGRVFSREDILREVHETDVAAYEYAVSSSISRLRKKLEVNPQHPTFIETVRGVGYRLIE